MAEAAPLVPPPPDPPPGFLPNPPPTGQGERSRQNAGSPTDHSRGYDRQGARSRHEAGLSSGTGRRPRSPAPRRGARLPPDNTPPEGPAYVLLKRTDGTSFVRANPFKVRRALVHLCGEVNTAKTLRSGALLIQTRSGEQNSIILRLTTFLDKDVEAVVADRLNSVTGLFYCPEVRGIPEEELLGELASQGVTEITRFRDVKDGPNPLVKARFRGLTLPTHIYCGYLAVPVREWVPGPMQCRNCWQFGHHDRTCRTPDPLCGKCCGAHHTDGCQSEAERCPSCTGSHPRGTGAAQCGRPPRRRRSNGGPASPPPPLLPGTLEAGRACPPQDHLPRCRARNRANPGKAVPRQRWQRRTHRVRGHQAPPGTTLLCRYRTRRLSRHVVTRRTPLLLPQPPHPGDHHRWHLGAT